MLPTGRQLRARRLALALSLTEIAAALGISTPYLWDLEHGHRPMDEAKRRRYLAALGKAEKKVRT